MPLALAKRHREIKERRTRYAHQKTKDGLYCALIPIFYSGLAFADHMRAAALHQAQIDNLKAQEQSDSDDDFETSSDDDFETSSDDEDFEEDAQHHPSTNSNTKGDTKTQDSNVRNTQAPLDNTDDRPPPSLRSTKSSPPRLESLQDVAAAARQSESHDIARCKTPELKPTVLRRRNSAYALLYSSGSSDSELQSHSQSQTHSIISKRLAIPTGDDALTSFKPRTCYVVNRSGAIFGSRPRASGTPVTGTTDPSSASSLVSPRSVNMPLADRFISRHHFSVQHEGGKFAVTDLNSANGTLIRKRYHTVSLPGLSIEPPQHSEAMPLERGVHLMIGSTELVIANVVDSETLRSFPPRHADNSAAAPRRFTLTLHVRRRLHTTELEIGDREIFIGSSPDADIVLDNPHLRAKHCAIFFHSVYRRFFIRDTQIFSRSFRKGTLRFNGFMQYLLPESRPVVLNSGDIIRAGHTEFVVSIYRTPMIRADRRRSIFQMQFDENGAAVQSKAAALAKAFLANNAGRRHTANHSSPQLNAVTPLRTLFNIETAPSSTGGSGSPICSSPTSPPANNATLDNAAHRTNTNAGKHRLRKELAFPHSTSEPISASDQELSLIPSDTSTGTSSTNTTVTVPQFVVTPVAAKSPRRQLPLSATSSPRSKSPGNSCHAPDATGPSRGRHTKSRPASLTIPQIRDTIEILTPSVESQPPLSPFEMMQETAGEFPIEDAVTGERSRAASSASAVAGTDGVTGPLSLASAIPDGPSTNVATMQSLPLQLEKLSMSTSPIDEATPRSPAHVQHQYALASDGNWEYNDEMQDRGFIRDRVHSDHNAIFAVYDGHQSRLVADFVCASLHVHLASAFSREISSTFEREAAIDDIKITEQQHRQRHRFPYLPYHGASAEAKTAIDKTGLPVPHVQSTSPYEWRTAPLPGSWPSNVRATVLSNSPLTGDEGSLIPILGLRDAYKHAHYVCPVLKRSELDTVGSRSMAAAFASTHEQLCGLGDVSSYSGCTAVVSFLYHHPITNRVHLSTGNLGDARAILCRAGRPVMLTRDHKTDSKDEEQRVLKSGGKIFRNRLGGCLEVTRAFGDIGMHSFGLSPVPFVCETELTSEDSHLVLSSDGLWDVVSPQEVVDFLCHPNSQNQSCRELALALVEMASQRATRDNVYMVVSDLSWS
jgi:serine/threonine protein phosphatase PrpC/pSer/pThr/pTyr-binding forkhead associated (FHA) protein